MEIDLLRGLITAALLFLFVGLFVFTWSRKRTETFEHAARMPLEENDRPAPQDTKEQTQ